MERLHLKPLTPTTAGGGTPLRVAFRTLGCRLNQYDTQGLKTTLDGLYDLDIVDWHEPAQVYILNSCTVTAKADQECRRLARQVKRRHPASKVVVVGCYAQTQPEVLARVPEIDGVVGNATKDDVAHWLPAVLGSAVPLLRVDDFTADPRFDSPLIDEFPGRSRAFVKVQDGCNLRCTYCLIWRARGPGRSRPAADVLAQLQKLMAGGWREAILAGVHLGGYGRDLPGRDSLPRLLRTCLETLPDLRLRLGSIHPNEVTAQLLSLFRQHPHLRPHLHISLQSGSSEVLRRMKRPYRRERAWAAVTQAAATLPGFGLGADLIVGFPGETEAEFEDTCRLVAELPFSYLHVFRFSPRPSTEAAVLPDQVPASVMTRRSGILRELADRKQAEFARNLVGTRREAVIEAAGTDGPWRQATTENYASVLVPDPGCRAGTLVTLAINDYRDGCLYGNVHPGHQHRRSSGAGE